MDSMNEIVVLTNVVSLPVKIAWVVWLVWMAVQVGWYQWGRAAAVARPTATPMPASTAPSAARAATTTSNPLRRKRMSPGFQPPATPAPTPVETPADQPSAD